MPNEKIITKMTNILKIKLSDEQYLSHVASQLPKSNGVHLILAKTGVGKTHHMLEQCHVNGGTAVFPVKAVMNQSLKYKADNSLQGTIIQIEHLDKWRTNQNELHVDEAQILYLGGFRKSVEKLYETIVEASQTKPVYLYSATVRTEFMPLKFNSIIHVEKGFERNVNVITLDSKGDVKIADAKLAQSLEYIDQQGDKAKVMAFINSNAQASAVVKRLSQTGKKAILLSSSSIRSGEAKAVYQSIISHAAISQVTYDYVICTSCMAEGINTNDYFKVVSCQDESGNLFQQQGRARGSAEHWVILGDLENKDHGYISLSYNKASRQIWRTSTVDGDVKRVPINVECGLASSTELCEWLNHDARANADLASLFTSQFQKGVYAKQVLKELDLLGYKVDQLLSYESDVKTKNNGKVSLQRLAKVLYQSGGKVSFKRNGSKYALCNDDPEIELKVFEDGVLTDLPALASYLIGNKDTTPALVQMVQLLNPDKSNEQIDNAVQELIEWDSSWNKYNFRGDKWNVMSIINGDGRAFLRNIHQPRYKEIKQEIDNAIAGMSEVIMNKYSGIISDEKVAEAASQFWINAYPISRDNGSDNRHFHSDDNKTLRLRLFKLMMGITYDKDGHWVAKKEKAIWHVVLDHNDRRKYNRKADTVKSKGIEMSTYHEVTKFNMKEVAVMKPKPFKQSLNDVINQINF
ncbi:hypothetical protein [Enterovibrio nigricans]|nr:hypothetical protein [Enterovibrio nigricans]